MDARHGANPELVVKFGQHKGSTIEQIPSSYLRWMVEKLDEKRFNNAELIGAAQHELKYRDQHDAHFEDATSSRNRDARGRR